MLSGWRSSFSFSISFIALSARLSCSMARCRVSSLFRYRELDASTWLIYGLLFRMVFDHKPFGEAVFSWDSITFGCIVILADAVIFYFSLSKKAKSKGHLHSGLIHSPAPANREFTTDTTRLHPWPDFIHEVWPGLFFSCFIFASHVRKRRKPGMSILSISIMLQPFFIRSLQVECIQTGSDLRVCLTWKLSSSWFKAVDSFCSLYLFL